MYGQLCLAAGKIGEYGHPTSNGVSWIHMDKPPSLDVTFEFKFYICHMKHIYVM